MIKFGISAPGRVSLYGEHTEMYSKNVVVASLDLRTTLKFRELTNDPNYRIKIEFPDVDLWLYVPLNPVINFFFASNNKELFEDRIMILKHVQYFITSRGMWRTHAQRFSLQVFFFLFIYLSRNERINIKSFQVHLDTQLPITGGLGSSTSFAVCLAACFIHWARLQRGEHGAFSDENITKISEYAKFCEEVTQNYVFSCDHYVCSYGRIIQYRYKTPVEFHINLINVPKMNILLIDSRTHKNKAEQITQMAEMKLSCPTFNVTVDVIDNASNMACRKMAEINDIITDNNFSQLEEMYIALGVSLFLFSLLILLHLFTFLCLHKIFMRDE